MSSPKEQIIPLRVFYSYAHHSRKDTSLKRDLEKQLGNLRQQGQIRGWSIDNISPGMDKEQVTLTNLDNAHIILILISPDYMDSDYHYDEMLHALERRKANKAYILFILLRPTELEDAEFNKYEDYFYPSYHKSITSYSNRDEAFNIIAQGIRKVVQEFRELEKTFKASQTASRPTPINRLSTPMTTQASPRTTTGNNISRKRAKQPDSQINAQVAEPAATQVVLKKPLPKIRNTTRVNTTQVSKGLTSKGGSPFLEKFFSSKELDRCSSRKGNSDLLFFLFILLDIVGLTIWLGDSLVILEFPWFITFVIVLLLFIWGVYNIYLPIAVALSFVFGGAWAMVAYHNQGWTGSPLIIILIVVWTLNFFLFKSHKKQGIFKLH